MIQNVPMHTIYRPTLSSNLRATYFVFRNRLTTYSRYKGQVIMSVLTPILVAAIPILLGHAIGGSNAIQNFSSNAQVSAGSLQGYMLIGALLFQLVSNSLWNFGFWLRREQQTGTLESGVYLVPTGKVWLIIGSSLYVLVRNAVSFVLALVLGVIVFSLAFNEFLSTTLFLGILFLLLGLPPIIGLALVLGAIVLRFKEVGTLIELMQWVISFFMGVFFPVTVFPPLLRLVTDFFPPAWTTNEIRAALYQAPYFLSLWQDIIVSIGFAFIVPIIALVWFSKVEKSVLASDGVGKY